MWKHYDDSLTGYDFGNLYHSKYAQICPVCCGSGKYKDKLEDKRRKCHGCDGKGWIVVR